MYEFLKKISPVSCKINHLYPQDLRSRYNAGPSSTSSQPDEDEDDHHEVSSGEAVVISGEASYDEVLDDVGGVSDIGGLGTEKSGGAATIFHPRPLCSFRGHTSDVLDICWSKVEYFKMN